MKKIKLLLMAIMAVGLVGCGGEETAEPSQSEDISSSEIIEINYDLTLTIELEGEVHSVLEFAEGETAFEIMERNLDIDYDEYDFGAMLTRIEDLIPGEGQWIFYDINGTPAGSGVSSYLPLDLDILNFYLV